MRQCRIHSRPPYPTERDVLVKQPPLDDAMILCIDAWRALGTCRAIGFGAVGPVPATAVWQWCDRRGLDADVARMVEHVIARLDGDFLEAEASRRANEKGG